MDNKSKGLKILVIILVFFLIGLCGLCCYGYSEYKQLKSDNNQLESKYNDLTKEFKQIKAENKDIKDKINNISNNQNTNNNDTTSQNNNSNNQNANYKVAGNKHIYSSESDSSVYAINGEMYLSSSNGSKSLNMNESDVNKAIVKESPQGVLAYILMQNGSTIRYYYGSSFDKKNVFKNYKIKNLTINCKGGEDGACSFRTYTITLLDGSTKTVNSDE